MPVHRVVLSAASQFFRRLFANPLKEAPQTEFRLKEVDADALALLIRFCYNGRLAVGEVNLQVVIETAAYFQIDEAVKICCQKLAECINDENCLSIGLLAAQHSFKVLREMTNRYVHENFDKICQNDEFLDLSLDHVVDLLQCDSLITNSEEVVFHAAMRWLRHDEINRQEFGKILMSGIRVGKLASKVRKHSNSFFSVFDWNSPQ